ncbi:hypothetical protein H0H92_012839 [Tricholoma furcatifolium]|nr:hypothetical protein H0H92_012839 [Tricholoma furcatifolium]
MEGTTIGYVAILSGPAPDPDLDPGLYNVAVALANASPALSFGTNSMATSFIAYVLCLTPTRGQLRIIRKSPARGQAQFKVWNGPSMFPHVSIFNINARQAMYPAIVTYLIHGPFSMIGIHQTATAVYQSQESPS